MQNNSSFPDNVDKLFINCNIATMTNNSYCPILDGAIAVVGSKICFAGKKSDLPKDYAKKCSVIHDMEKSWILPGLVDCHTHLVFGGSRSKEFEMKLTGVSYEEIAKQGGGIFSTVKDTRNESIDILYENALKRVNCLFNQGATTIEIKSGYGLDLETELKMLEVIKKLDDNHAATIKATFLGAHALPHEYKNKSNEYICFLVDQVLPEVKKQGIATSVDAFCETIGFSLKETEKVLKKVKELGFDLKLHAEQLTDSGRRESICRVFWGTDARAKARYRTPRHGSQMGTAGLCLSRARAVLVWRRNTGTQYDFLGESVCSFSAQAPRI